MQKGRVAVRGARKNGLQHVCLDYGQTGGIWKRGHQRRRATMAAAMTTIGALHSSRFRIEIQDGAREGKKGRSGFSSNSSSTSLSSAIRLDWLFLGFLPLFFLVFALPSLYPILAPSFFPLPPDSTISYRLLPHCWNFRAKSKHSLLHSFNSVSTIASAHQLGAKKKKKCSCSSRR